MRNVYEQYLPTREDIRAKELSGKHKQEKKPKPRGYWYNDAMSKALDKVNI